MSGREDVLAGLEGYTRGPWRADRYYVRPKGRDVAISASASAGFTVAETYANTELQARAPALVDEIQALREALGEALDMLAELVRYAPGAKDATPFSDLDRDALALINRAHDMLPDTPEEER